MYKEDLPDGCPDILGAVDQQLTDVWRFLRGRTPTVDCFVSHGGRGRNCPEDVCECRWSSCSLFVGEKTTRDMLKTTFYKRFKARAKIIINQGDGKSIAKASHVDFWAYDTFDFLQAIAKVEPK